MKGWIRLGILLSAIWVVGVVCFTIASFYDIPSTVCVFYNKTTLNGAPPPLYPNEFESLYGNLFSCSIFTEILYPAHNTWKCFAIISDLQMIEFDVIHFLELLFIPLAAAWVGGVSLIKGIQWVRSGFSN